MIRFENVTKNHALKASQRPNGSRHLLHDISFHLPSGSNLAILGHPGSGKAMMLKLIGGLDFPDQGKISRRGTVSWPFGEVRFEQSMTILQNLRFMCRVLGIRDFAGVEAELRRLTGFERELRQPVSILPEREKRALNVAFSLCFSFEIFLVQGNPVFFSLRQREVLRAAYDKYKSESCLILATTEIKDIKPEFSHVLLMENGTGRLYDNPQDAIEAFGKENEK